MKYPPVYPPLLERDPKGEPEGLFPVGVPALVLPFPLGTMEYGKASVLEAISSYTAKSANSFSALAFYRFKVAYLVMFRYFYSRIIIASRFYLEFITLVFASFP